MVPNIQNCFQFYKHKYTRLIIFCLTRLLIFCLSNSIDLFNVIANIYYNKIQLYTEREESQWLCQLFLKYEKGRKRERWEGMRKEKIVSLLFALCPLGYLHFSLCFQDFNDHLPHVMRLSEYFGKSQLMPTSTPLEHFSGSIVMSSRKCHKVALPE